MNKQEMNYLSLLGQILNGSEREDRTGVGTYGIFGTQLRFSLEGGTIPLLTTKKMFTKGIIEELLFFIRGETDTKKLEEKGVKIWTGNTSREFLDKKGLTNYAEGEMGPMYGFQWRKFGQQEVNAGELCGEYDSYATLQGVDQLQNAFDLIKNDPTSRRIIVSAYNPTVSSKCVLEPCHMFFQFHVEGEYLSCQWYQRSVDSFLGLPFNIASYALLTHMMAKATGLKAKELIFSGGDTHIYKNHVKQVMEQIIREPYPFPVISIKKDLTSIADMEKLEAADFEFIGYRSHPGIKAEMAI